jgi:hypothetical protein
MLTAYSLDTIKPEPHGIAEAKMDRSVKPGDDFYQYAKGHWIKRTEIPADCGYTTTSQESTMSSRIGSKDFPSDNSPGDEPSRLSVSTVTALGPKEAECE